MSWTTAGPRPVRTIALRDSLRLDVLPRALARAIARALVQIVVIVLIALGISIAHEMGHALVATLFGARVVMFNVFGMQWYPTLEWMPELGFGGYVYWWAPPDRNLHWVIVMAGSNFTLLLALVSALSLNLISPRGLARTALVVMSLYALDSLAKIVVVLRLFPLGWNVRFTRSFSEAYYAALGLGITGEIYISIVVLLSVIIAWLLVRALRNPPPLAARDTI